MDSEGDKWEAMVYHAIIGSLFLIGLATLYMMWPL